MSEQPDTGPMQFITNQFGDELLYEVNRNTFNLLGANALYEAHFEKRLDQEDTLYIVIGTDSGLLMKWILDRDTPAGSRYLFIEPEGLIDPIGQKYPGIKQKTNRVSLRSIEDWVDLARDYQFQDYAYLDRIAVVQSIGALDAFIPEYHTVRYTVEQEIERLNRHVMLSQGNHSFIRRQIENVTENLVPLTRIQGGFEDYTAVLLGGGPSLDSILPWVKSHREQLVLIAVSRIARQLLAEGIQPDIVATIDPHPVSYEVSKEMLEFDDECLLVNSYHAAPLLLSQWQGPAVYRGPHYPWKSKREANNLGNIGPTVGNQALATATDMGFHTIILGGVDLCYSQEGHTHASGSNERQLGPDLGKVGLQVETNAGGMADTAHGFMLGISSMGHLAGQARKAGCRVINPAPHAARIPNVDHEDLSDIKLNRPVRPFRETLKQRLGANSLTAREHALAEVKKELAHANGRLREIVKLCDEASQCNKRLFGGEGQAGDFKYKKRMDKIERKLNHEFADFSPLIKEYAAPAFLRLSRPDREKEWSDEELKNAGSTYYKAYRQGAEQLLQLVESAQKRTASRLDELSADHPVTEIYEQWKTDQTYGRVRLWRRWHKDRPDELSPRDLQCLERAEQAFTRLLHRDSRMHQQYLEQTQGHGLGPVRSKLAVLFSTRNQNELERLAEQISQVDDQDAADLNDLARAYLAELAGHTESAVEYYNRILDRASDKLKEDEQALQNPSLEDALRRLSYITLNNGDQQNALAALSILSQVSPTYETQYGDLLRITGNIIDAVDVYTDHLKKIPHDVVTMLKLGQLYQDIGAIDSARSAYEFVLQQSPDNKAARKMRSSLEAVPTSS